MFTANEFGEIPFLQLLMLFSLLGINAFGSLIITCVAVWYFLRKRALKLKKKYTWLVYSVVISIVQYLGYLSVKDKPNLDSLPGFINLMILTVSIPIMVVATVLVIAEVLARRIEKKN